ncbi:MAG: sigma-54-dependent Fis family transcriptional regulator [Gammaproteobacteria bacterium]|nr:sigma-54-dependent Fis family transcriptional regulator [Gammaproteobacteria bacterium]
MGSVYLPSLLLVDDDSIISESLKYVLSDEYEVSLAFDRENCIEVLGSMPSPPQVVLVDLGLPPDTHKPDEGFAVIEYICKYSPCSKVIVLSGQDERKYVDAAKKLGAVDFVAKPCDIAELKVRLKQQVKVSGELPNELQPLSGIIGESPAIELLRMQIKQLADSPFPVLIHGESGSGKELAAQNLHSCSLRKKHPFLTLNCAAFNDELLASQLFGHARGAFTGATENKSGFFEEAGQGTLLLDEIADLPIDLQAKLLRVLENGEYYRVGETHPRMAQARVLAASNKDLIEAIDKGLFREDLYHRLSVLTIRVPSVNEREQDKLILLKYFQQQLNQQVSGFELDEGAKQLWVAYDFPGNVRELRNIIIRLSAKYPGQTIKRSVLEQELMQVMSRHGDVNEMDVFRKNLKAEGFQLNEELKRIEKEYIKLALQESLNNMSKAASLLGVNRSTLYGRLDRSEEVL